MCFAPGPPFVSGETPDSDPFKEQTFSSSLKKLLLVLPPAPLQKNIFQTKITLRRNQFNLAKLGIFRASTLGVFDTTLVTLLCFNWHRRCLSGM